MNSYTLDTNILIGLQQRYPRDIFESAWIALEDTVDDGRACICSEVLDETNRGGDDLYKWAKGYPDFVCDLSKREVDLAAQISRLHPEWVRGTTNAADPFLVAHAKADSLIIVTEERRAGHGVTDRNQKVPNVADEFGVVSMSFFEFARLEGWKF